MRSVFLEPQRGHSVSSSLLRLNCRDSKTSSHSWHRYSNMGMSLTLLLPLVVYTRNPRASSWMSKPHEAVPFGDYPRTPALGITRVRFMRSVDSPPSQCGFSGRQRSMAVEISSRPKQTEVRVPKDLSRERPRRRPSPRQGSVADAAQPAPRALRHEWSPHRSLFHARSREGPSASPRDLDRGTKATPRSTAGRGEPNPAVA
jgi:hypothetical protein